MKTSLFLISLFICLSSFARPCQSNELSKQYQRIDSYSHVDSQFKMKLKNIEYNTKKSQVYACLDELMNGQKISFNIDELTIAHEIANYLIEHSYSYRDKESAEYLKELLNERS